MSMVAYKCPNCAGPLSFTPEEDGFRCEYCQSFFTDAQLKEMYKDLDENLENQEADEPQPQEKESMEGVVYYTCPGCGAEIVTDENTAATFCYYCHSPVVLGGRLSGELKPDYVIPFALSKEQAVKEFFSFCGKKKFLPKDFLSQNHIEKMTGIYFPYWLTDGDVGGSYTARGEKVRSWTTGDTRHTETKIFRLVREGSAHLEFLPVGASKSNDRAMMKFVHPYNKKDMENFSMTYLSGFQADKRDMELAETERLIDGEMVQYTEKAMADTIVGYTSVTKIGSALNVTKKVSKYALLPVWTLTYKHGGKTYVYSLNGQTGKTYGELPVSKSKLACFAGLISGIVFAASLVVGYFV